MMQIGDAQITQLSKTKCSVIITSILVTGIQVNFFKKGWLCTGKSLSEALLFAEHGENMLCTEIVSDIQKIFCTKHVLPYVLQR